jgi:hypothetical protein
MNTTVPEAFFENISDILLDEISKAEISIYVAVAWFTSLDLFSALKEKTQKGCKVSLIILDDEINRGSIIEHDTLNFGISKVYWIKAGSEKIMHNKFCILDNKVTITGSYNWSYRAEKNFENIVILRDSHLAKRYVGEFNNIVKLFYPAADEAGVISKKGSTSSFEVTQWIDPNVSMIRFQIELLEYRLEAMTNEKIELEKLIDLFQRRYSHELNELILEVLQLRKKKFKNGTAEYQEAAEEEAHYKEQLTSIENEDVFELSDSDLILLKANFRKACLLCHPDRVAEEDRFIANGIFIELRKAYGFNDLKRVKEILGMLETGCLRKIENNTDELALLYKITKRLELQIRALESDISEIRRSKIYLTISKLSDWDCYFKETRTKLEIEKESLIDETLN